MEGNLQIYLTLESYPSTLLLFTTASPSFAAGTYTQEQQAYACIKRLWVYILETA